MGFLVDFKTHVTFDVRPECGSATVLVGLLLNIFTHSYLSFDSYSCRHSSVYIHVLHSVEPKLVRNDHNTSIWNN
jgi:hypothetical protein